MPSKNWDSCDFSKKMRKIGEIAEFAKTRKLSNSSVGRGGKASSQKCDFSKNSKKNKIIINRRNRKIC